MKGFAIACLVLLSTSEVRAQRIRAADHAFDFDSKDVGLTETLLKFTDRQHIPIAIEYLDADSMNRPIDVSLRNDTIAQALDSILSHGQGYAWTLQNGIIEIKNRHASKRAEAQLNTVIPVFDISAGLRVDVACAMLWRELQVAHDPSLRQQGYGGDFLGDSSKINPATLRNQTVRQILCYIVANSRAQGWIVAGPPKCLGSTPYCGLWYLMEGESKGTSYQMVLTKIRENF